MQFFVRHSTRYRYAKAVHLSPHIIRLHPRADGNLTLQDYRCLILPEPTTSAYCLDCQGNVILHATFAEPTRTLEINTRFVAHTSATGGLEPMARATLPVVYDDGECGHLTPYLEPNISELSRQPWLHALLDTSNRHPLTFLDLLNEYLYRNIQREIRPEGAPQTPELTIARGRGACRDVSVLFIALSRSQGFAARFVSGYQAKPETDHGMRFLHAWPEVYIPRVGWQGYDPTHGTRVNAGHVALAASHSAAGAAPIEGYYYGKSVASQLDFNVEITAT